MNSARERENWLSKGTHTHMCPVHICSSEIKPVTEMGSQDDVFTDVRKHKHTQTGLESATEETG